MGASSKKDAYTWRSCQCPGRPCSKPSHSMAFGGGYGPQEGRSDTSACQVVSLQTCSHTLQSRRPSQFMPAQNCAVEWCSLPMLLQDLTIQWYRDTDNSELTVRAVDTDFKTDCSRPLLVRIVVRRRFELSTIRVTSESGAIINCRA